MKQKFKYTLSTSDLKWRGKKAGLPDSVTYTLSPEDVDAVFVRSGRNEETGTVVIPAEAMREWLVGKIVSDYGKKPSNRFWMYIGYEKI